MSCVAPTTRQVISQNEYSAMLSGGSRHQIPSVDMMLSALTKRKHPVWAVWQFRA